MQLAIGLLIPFVGTVLGSAMVFLMKNRINNKVQKLLLGFASGVMIAAAIWSLLILAIDMSKEQGVTAWVPASVGFLAGMLFLLLLDNVIPHLHLSATKPEGPQSKLKRTTMLVLAVTLHNIPEGMAVGVTFAVMNSRKPKDTELPNLIGMSIKEATNMLKELNLEISINNEQEGLDKESTIITDQMPSYGISVNEGSKIYVDH